jgi:hypothetical protein
MGWQPRGAIPVLHEESGQLQISQPACLLHVQKPTGFCFLLAAFHSAGVLITKNNLTFSLTQIRQ